jgi:hypothetical protein
MTPINVITCPECGTLNSQLIKNSLMICKRCYAIVNGSTDPVNKAVPMPDDWSFIQIGTTFEHNKKVYSIVGRVRLQLRNDYKNLWYSIDATGERSWLMDSFGSLAVLNVDWKEFTQKSNQLHAGNTIKLSSDFIVRGEFVEKCELMNFQGEIHDWRLMSPGFFVVQAGTERLVALFTTDHNDVNSITGEKIEIDQLGLKNILIWDEWK